MRSFLSKTQVLWVIRGPSQIGCACGWILEIRGQVVTNEIINWRIIRK
jgi:hypothetical protein